MTLRNRESLRDSSRVFPLLERMAMCVLGDGRMRSIVRCESSEQEENSWIVFADDSERGIGVSLGGSAQKTTWFHKRLCYVRCAKNLVNGLRAGADSFPLSLIESDRTPDGWRIYTVTMGRRSVLCAVSKPPPIVNISAPSKMLSSYAVRVRVVATCVWAGRFVTGVSASFEVMQCELSGEGIQGRLRKTEEGAMVLTPEEGSLSAVEKPSGDLIVRIELGELRLTLEELAGLRKGSELELEGSLPRTCYVTVGSTTLAVGELSESEGCMRLQIVEIVDPS